MWKWENEFEDVMMSPERSRRIMSQSALLL